MVVSTEEAVLRLRELRGCESLIADTYLDADVAAAARRFATSAEFAATLALLDGSPRGLDVLDLGAGQGIASFAFARAGARRVVAIEPDASEIVGLGALQQACRGLPVEAVSAFADRLPLDAASIDVVYARQVLHHVPDLVAALREVQRVLRPGGTFVATREHVVDDDEQLRAFLAAHPVHQLTQGEHAWSLDEYRGALGAAGLGDVRVLGPWDSVINAYPRVRSEHERRRPARTILVPRLGRLGAGLARMPAVNPLVRARLRSRREPGRMFSFVARRPGRPPDVVESHAS